VSNDLILQMKNELAAIGGGLDEDTKAVAGGGGGGSFNKRISIEGGVFRKYVGGKEVATIPERHMDIVFVKMAHTASRTFYKEAYKKGIKIPPSCWSTDSKVPDADVKTPQAASCDKCPMSIKGSNASGLGTACRLSWRTAVVLPNDPAGDVMQLVLPAASCFGKEDAGKWPFRPYVQMLANNNISAGRVVTKMQFDMNSSSPKLFFSPVGAVVSEHVETIQRQGKSPSAESAVKLTVFQTDEGDNGVFPAPAAPVVAQEEDEVEVIETSAEPKLRETKKPDAAPVADVASVVAKWAKK